MKHRNRVLAFLMTLVMIISQFAGNAMTVHAELESAVDNQETVELLRSMVVQ